MQKYTTLLFCILAIGIASSAAVGIVYAQESPPEPTLEVSDFQIVILIIGVFGGLTTAYNGYRKKKQQEGEKFKFDRGAFLDRVIMAIIVSVPLAIVESQNVGVTLDLFGAIIIYLASIGGAELILEVRKRNAKPT